MRDAKKIFEHVLKSYARQKRTVNNEYGFDFRKLERELRAEVKRLREEFDQALERERK